MPPTPPSPQSNPGVSSSLSVENENVRLLSDIIGTTTNPRECAAKVAELKARYQKDVFGISVKVEGQ